MIRFIFIRHAESEMNADCPDLICGQSNHIKLSDLGRKQAKALGTYYKDKFNPETHCIWASIAVRNLETVAIFCQHAGISHESIVYSEQLLELAQGDWVGKSRAQIYTPEVLAQVEADNWNFKAPNGESQREVEGRMYDWLQKQIQNPEMENKTVLVFSHGLAIKCLIRKLLQSSPKMTNKIRIDNTSMSQFTYTRTKGWWLDFINNTPHLLDS